MMDHDMHPTRFDLSLEYTREFILEWFDQNSLGEIGVVGMRGGVGKHIGEMAGQFESMSTLNRSFTNFGLQEIHKM